MPIKRALISVSNKAGLSELAPFLLEYKIEILSTGGTRRYLESLGIKTTDISSYTGFPEIMDGRVKTLHPKVHGGILSVRDNEGHKQAMEEHGIEYIDLLIVNLYPFREVVESKCSFEEAIENIDIGGPTMIRAGAKNFKYVTVVTDPNDYPELIRNMKENNGDTSLDFRFYLAQKVFKLTYEYDKAIFEYLSSRGV
ncbi:MAG: IMP cyclohydrolase [Desulfobacterota bacterium]|nr:IMP cyclohydrolase [Thermodesulfobacteriota bacterium]MDW8002170.1 IMP cyclohydrolase [Deltaproteobacteria bacterium]